MNLVITNTTDQEIPEDLLKNVEAAARKQLKYNGVIELTLLTNHSIQALNKEYRGKDYPTDVLSWAFNESPVQFDHELLGEVYLSLEKVTEQAAEKGHSQEYEIAYIFAHGILHLLGYDHQTDEEEAEMNELTEMIVNQT